MGRGGISGAGGAITADSDSKTEYEETLTKVMGLMAVLSHEAVASY